MEITFYIKKIISAILLPLPWIILSFILGLILLWFTRHQLTGKIFVTLGLVALIIIVLPFLPNYLLKNLESRYPPLLQPSSQMAYVVVLGGGQYGHENLNANSLLKDFSLARLVEGIRLYRAIPGSRLILSGGSAFDPDHSEAETMEKAAIALGVPPQDIVLETKAKDTREQAANLKPMLANKPFILVTSAFHMARAMMFFKNQGLQPIPAPTGYYALTIWPGKLPSSVISPRSMLNVNTAIHEYLGIWWEELKQR